MGYKENTQKDTQYKILAIMPLSDILKSGACEVYAHILTNNLRCPNQLEMQTFLYKIIYDIYEKEPEIDLDEKVRQYKGDLEYLIKKSAQRN